MPYITVMQNQTPHQLTWEDVMFRQDKINTWLNPSRQSGTITRFYETIPESVLNRVDVPSLIRNFEKFNEHHQALFLKDRASLYSTFRIPKKTGGYRRIDAPCEKLQLALSELSYILTEVCGVLYHTSAFAYVKKRCTVECVKKHADFKSNWFLKTDLSDFFGSTTLDHAMHMLSMIFPISEILKTEGGYEAVKKALSLGFLRGGLPQGTTLSPTLTNILMIPIDHKLFNALADRKMVYTRYADDMNISAVEQFPYQRIVKLIETTFREFGAPYRIKDEKTHYGSIKGRNWMLGLMLNADHNITVGYRKKRNFKAALCNFILDTINGKPWSLDDVVHLEGELSYFKMVEKAYFSEVIRRANTKWGVDAEGLIRSYKAALSV